MSAKIALIVVIPAVLMVFFFTVYQYAFERRTIMRNAETALLQVGENLKAPAEESIRSKNFTSLQTTMTREILSADIEFAAIYDAGRNVVACNKKQWLGRKLADMQLRELTETDVAAVQKAFGGGYSSYYDAEDSETCLVMPLFADDVGQGVLFLALNMDRTNDAIQQRAIEMFLIALLVTVLFGVSTYFLFHILLIKRVKKVSAAALKLAAGDTVTRADVDGVDEISYLATSFNLLADEITNWRTNLEEMASSRLRDLTVLYHIIETISSSLELGVVLPKVLDLVLENLGAGKGVVVLVDRDGRTLVLGGHRGLSEESLSQIIDKGQGCTGDVILKNTSIRVEGDEDDEGSLVPGLEDDNIRSALVVPISVRGTVFGAFAVYSGRKDRFSDQDESKLITVANQIGVAVENARLYEKTLDLAQKDGLTGVFNRRYLMEQLNLEMIRADRYHTALSLIILDLDKFKSFNDTYGHVKGDELLKAFAKMVSASIRTTDVCARYGGEEFCVILPNTPISGGAAIAERIRRGMEDLRIEITPEQPLVGRTVSIGVAEFSGKQTMEQFVAVADLALYRAKEGGRNRVVW